MKKTLLLIMLIISGFSYSQKKFRIEMDYARFNFDDSSGYMELYYSFHQNELTSIRTDGAELVRGLLQVTIKDEKTGNAVIDKTWQVNDQISRQQMTEKQNKNLNGVISLQLGFGKYACTVKASDGYESVKKDSMSFRFEISPLPKDRLSMSDIELAGNINQTEKKPDGFFIKNNYEVIPNPSLVYGEKQPALFFYAEYYNLQSASGNINAEYRLVNSFEKDVYKKNKVLQVKNNSVADVGPVNINKFPSGVYSLIISLTDSVNNIKVSSAKKFYIVNSAVQDSSMYLTLKDNYLSSQFGSLSDDELEMTFQYSKYLASVREIEEWKKLTAESGRKKFLLDFWKERKSPADPSKTITWDEYLRSVEIANGSYSNYREKGWKTDRGRIRIMYGEPGEIERHPQESDSKAYETWHYYNIEGGVVFIFGDLQGFGGYSLIHSTKRGELKDESWERRLKTY